MAINPIWKDYVWKEQSDIFNSFGYKIKIGEDTIYEGKAYVYPGNNYAEILINDVCSNFLSSKIEFKNGTVVNSDYLKEFTLSVPSGDNKITFCNDWTYKPIDYSKPLIISDPIDNRVDYRQYLVSSWVFPTTTSLVNRVINGKKTNIGLDKGINGYNHIYDLKGESLECGSTITIDIQGKSSIDYIVDKSNKQYVLYYVNAYGGWDSLLIAGNSKLTDDIQSFEYTNNRKSNKYLNNITERWIFYTDYLNDKQSGKMHHLLESTNVYLHNLESNTIEPIIITNRNCEYKTYTNNGKKVVYYMIEAKSSKNKCRQ